MTLERLRELNRAIDGSGGWLQEMLEEVWRLRGLLEGRMWPSIISLPNVELPEFFEIRGLMETDPVVTHIIDRHSGRVVWVREAGGERGTAR